MSILSKLFNKQTKSFDIVDAFNKHDTEAIVKHIFSHKNKTNGISIPYTRESVSLSLSCLYQMQSNLNLSEIDIVSLLYMLFGGIINISGYSPVSNDRITYLRTCFFTLQTFCQLSHSNVKKYEISTCGDQRVCSKCAKHEGKVHMVSKAVIGKTAPPFCDKCRCSIMGVFN